MRTSPSPTYTLTIKKPNLRPLGAARNERRDDSVAPTTRSRMAARNASHLRQLAAETLVAAETMTDASCRRGMMSIAAGYKRLADYAEGEAPHSRRHPKIDPRSEAPQLRQRRHADEDRTENPGSPTSAGATPRRI